MKVKGYAFKTYQENLNGALSMVDYLIERFKNDDNEETMEKFLEMFDSSVDDNSPRKKMIVAYMNAILMVLQEKIEKVNEMEIEV